MKINCRTPKVLLSVAFGPGSPSYNHQSIPEETLLAVEHEDMRVQGVRVGTRYYQATTSALHSG